MQFITPQKDIDWALSVEKSVQNNEKALYAEIMNNVSMSERIKNDKEDNVDVATLIYCEAYDLGKQKLPYINPYVEKESSDAFIDAFREGYLKGFKEQTLNH